MKLSLDIKGIKGLEERLKNMDKAAKEGLDKVLSAGAIAINKKQVRYTPVNYGVLRRNNKFDTSQFLNKTLENNTKYAPFVEFGTGSSVNVPAEIGAEAMVFKGKGMQGKHPIKIKGKWVMVPYQNNLKSRPFFYRGYFEERPNIIKNIRNLFK